MLAFNLVLTLICFWLMLGINSYFIQPAKWNAFRFRLFALRDDLALLAMKGKIDECSQEYEMAMRMVNSTVNIARKFEVVSFLKFLWALKEDRKIKNKIDQMAKDTCHFDEEFQRIISEYFNVVHDMFHIHTRGFRIIAPTLIAIFGFARVFSHITLALKKKTDILEHLQEWLTADRNLAKCKVHL